MSGYVSRILLSLCGLAVATGVVQSQPRTDPRLVVAIDELVAKNGFSPDGPGVAILIRQPGRLQVMKGYGLANLTTRAPVTPQTRFYLASLSKSFTATAVLMLHERGKLSLQVDVRSYVPELPVYGEGQVIRIKDLLQHVSGLPEYLDLTNVPAQHRGYWVGADYLAELARRGPSLPLRFAPGQKYEYSNTNYVLLALVVERITRKSLGAFLRDEVFTPVGMKSTFVHEVHDALPPRGAPGAIPAVGYERGRQGWRESWGLPPFRLETLVPVGEGGVWSNLEDLARWDAAVRENRLLKRTTLEQALTPSRTRDGKMNNYGFGWSLYFNKAGKRIGYGHNGLWRGFRTSYYDYLVRKRTTVILSNRGDFDPSKFWYALDDVIEKYTPGR